jgi:hypothetical protein
MSEHASAVQVLGGTALWAVEQADCLAWLDSLPADSVDLALFSPPYQRARTYGIDFALDGQAWVDWMVRVFHACLRVCRGLVACVCEGQTRAYRYSCAPFLLMADLHRAGVHLRKPVAYRRVGIPGSGGPDWLRNDWEPVVCATRGGRLSWSDPTACGHPPLWAPGGAMSHRMSDGKRVNAHGVCRGKDCHRAADETPDYAKRPHTKRQADGDMETQGYAPPAVANPGNVVQQTFTAEEVCDMLGAPADVLDCDVGGGRIGSALAHENEAPFPEALAAFFVRSFCPPGGVVLDCFSGSGTTAAVAVRWGRRAVCCDVRESQVQLSRRRVAGETPTLFPADAPAPEAPA